MNFVDFLIIRTYCTSRLIAHPFIVTKQSRNEIGPVIFRLSAEYIKTAENNGLTFAGRESEHCYVFYLFKFDEQTNQYVPDFETLAFSFYEFPKKVCMISIDQFSLVLIVFLSFLGEE